MPYPFAFPLGPLARGKTYPRCRLSTKPEWFDEGSSRSSTRRLLLIRVRTRIATTAVQSSRTPSLEARQSTGCATSTLPGVGKRLLLSGSGWWSSGWSITSTVSSGTSSIFCPFYVHVEYQRLRWHRFAFAFSLLMVKYL